MNPHWADKILNDVRQIGLKNEYIQLILLWSLFNAWYREKYPNPKNNYYRDRPAVDWFRKGPNSLKNITVDFLQESEKDSLCGYARRLNIKIQRTNNKNSRYFPSPKNLSDIIELIYYVRCKIVHGEWQLDSTSDQVDKGSLISLCTRLLNNWARWAREKRVLY